MEQRVLARRALRARAPCGQRQQRDAARCALPPGRRARTERDGQAERHLEQEDAHEQPVERPGERTRVRQRQLAGRGAVRQRVAQARDGARHGREGDGGQERVDDRRAGGQQRVEHKVDGVGQAHAAGHGDEHAARAQARERQPRHDDRPAAPARQQRRTRNAERRRVAVLHAEHPQPASRRERRQRADRHGPHRQRRAAAVRRERPQPERRAVQKPAQREPPRHDRVEGRVHVAVLHERGQRQGTHGHEAARVDQPIARDGGARRLAAGVPPAGGPFRIPHFAPVSLPFTVENLPFVLA